MIRRRLLAGTLVAAAIAAAASGCGSGRSTSGSLDPKIVSAYVGAQVRALCLVQSKAYPTQAAQHAAYVRAEDSAQLSSSELAAARVAAAHDVALRTRISERVAATCGKR